jgi:predicted nucleotidyltransferase
MDPEPVMTRSSHQSSLRYPLTVVLGTEAQVRLMREFARHGGALSAPALVQRTGLAASSVREGLIVLERMQVTETLGQGRTRLHRLRSDHPLRRPLEALFEAEEARFESVLAALRDAAGRCAPGIAAVWLYGSVARNADRPGSDIDVAVLCEAGRSRRIETGLREAVREAEDRLFFTASIMALEIADALRLDAAADPWWRSLVRDARPLVGDRPDLLIGRLRRTVVSETAS